MHVSEPWLPLVSHASPVKMIKFDQFWIMLELLGCSIKPSCGRSLARDFWTKHRPTMRSFVLVCTSLAASSSAAKNQTTRQLRGSCIPSYHVNCIHNPNLVLFSLENPVWGCPAGCSFFASVVQEVKRFLCVGTERGCLGPAEFIMMRTKHKHANGICSI